MALPTSTSNCVSSGPMLAQRATRADADCGMAAVPMGLLGCSIRDAAPVVQRPAARMEKHRNPGLTLPRLSPDRWFLREDPRSLSVLVRKTCGVPSLSTRREHRRAKFRVRQPRATSKDNQKSARHVAALLTLLIGCLIGHQILYRSLISNRGASDGNTA